ncbi:protein fuzzy homolog isoform X1 [Notamacropus eugenii]|uniref:protein fuzzy homolog isoform X1 n=1 Tax=Notamacropus eugenii TaxID=9315 RepID=UPI003B66CA9F
MAEEGAAGSVHLLCLAASSGVPLFCRSSRGGAPSRQQLPFSVIGSLNGVHMFGQNLDVTLRSARTEDTAVVWRTFHDSVTLIVLCSEPGRAELRLERLLELVFGAMVLLVGLEELTRIRNVERLKKDLRVRGPPGRGGLRAAERGGHPRLCLVLLSPGHLRPHRQPPGGHGAGRGPDPVRGLPGSGGGAAVAGGPGGLRRGDGQRLCQPGGRRPRGSRNGGLVAPRGTGGSAAALAGGQPPIPGGPRLPRLPAPREPHGASPTAHADAATRPGAVCAVWASAPSEPGGVSGEPLAHGHPGAPGLSVALALVPPLLSQVLERWWQPLLEPLRACLALVSRGIPAGFLLHPDILGLLLLHLEQRRGLFTVDLSGEEGPSPSTRRRLLRSFYVLVTATHFPPEEKAEEQGCPTGVPRACYVVSGTAAEGQQDPGAGLRLVAVQAGPRRLLLLVRPQSPTHALRGLATRTLQALTPLL